MFTSGILRLVPKLFFLVDMCCDSVENDNSKIFNIVIMDANKKPIITMLGEFVCI